MTLLESQDQATTAEARTHRTVRVAVLAGLLLLAGWTFRVSLVQMWRTWDADPTFTHGFLIGPIALWLVWQRRSVFNEVVRTSNFWGLILLAMACLVWAAAVVLDIRVVAQLAAVAAIPILVLIVLGWRVTRAFAFPLAFLVFMVPFGKDIVPYLMQVTADLSVFFLNISGIPVLREEMLLHIPAGTFEVARACSGIKYLATATVIGILYANQMYASWTKRIVAVAVALAVAILANGLRAYLLVVIGHVTDMRFDHDGWHVVLGQVMFAIVMLIMFLIGHRFRDPEVAFVAPVSGRASPVNPRGRVSSLAVVALCSAALLLLSSRAAHPELLEMVMQAAPPVLALPSGEGGWRGPEASDSHWRPRYRNALSETEGDYVQNGTRVSVYIAAYRAPPGKGGEMISHHNQIDLRMIERQFVEHDLQVVTGDGIGTARAVSISQGDRRSVAYWFTVNDRPTTNRYEVKWLELQALLAGRVADERIVVVSVEGDRTDVLGDFLAAHGSSLGLVESSRSAH